MLARLLLARLLLALLPLAAPAAAAQSRGDTTTVATPRPVGEDSTPRQRRHAARERRPPKRAEVTPALLASAFRDAPARAILTLARAARMHQDSALQSYDATTYQRISAGLGLGRIGHDRLAYRAEQATRVRWRRGSGAYVEVTGSRSAMPIAGSDGRGTLNGDISPVPYYPGNESLWIGSSAAKSAVDENEGLVHPLAEGAEAYYTYESGDSVTFRLPGGRTILLRELRVRPREPRWNLAVGSLWFDMQGGQLVRAAYRMAVPMDIVAVSRSDDSSAFDDVPALIKPMLFPMTAQVSAIGVEYGLFDGRFWLPRLQVAEGGARMGMVRVPFSMEQRYEYADVNAGAPLPAIVVAVADTSHPEDNVDLSATIGADSAHPHAPRTAVDSARARRMARRAAQLRCDSTGTRSYTRSDRGGLNPVRVTITCDLEKLARSPELPASIYEHGETVVDRSAMDALVSQALAMGAQAAWAPQPLEVGAARPRYNRIEGLSLGVRADQVLGAGYAAMAAARVGIADREPVVEVAVSRSDLRRTLTLSAYNRLVPANDWGTPFALGSSVNALLFGRDDAYYYRASGLEVTSRPDEAAPGAWRWSAFAEEQRSARVNTGFSLARAIVGTAFDTNIVAARELALGARSRFTSTLGENPQGTRLFSDLRLEGARGAISGLYARAALDLTLSHGIGDGAVALTLAGGTSAGRLPAQRSWYLGGVETVRGQRPGTASGDAFWLARADYAYGRGVVRPVVFADLGWAGDRARWRAIGQPLSGAGVGMTVLDGLVRVDLSRGIAPGRGWRVDSYLNARF
jgi:hypothetical protein